MKLKDKFYKSFYLLLAILLLCSHDLYIKMDTYFFKPNQEATLSLYNGTFEKSENIITRDRILDASVVGQGERTTIQPNQWKDQDSTITQLTFNTGNEGTYVVGVSTKARNIELSADKFNSYLEHDGVLDMLEQRRNNNQLDQDAVESYQKHVKAIYQVGGAKTEDWGTVLGYPIEFVPQTNPYEKYTGEILEVQLLLEGKPLSNQLVYADFLRKSDNHIHNHSNHQNEHTTEEGSHEHSHNTSSHEYKKEKEDHSHKHSHSSDGHGHSHDHPHSSDKQEHSQKPKKEETHTHTSGQQLLTNEQGIVSVDLPEDGVYFLRTIHMTTVSDSDELTHQSKWATLTFEVSHKHGDDTHTHDHDDEESFPTWMFVLGSAIIVVLLFLVFRKRN